MSQKVVKQGDTIVEALFALAVFGFVAVACLMVMQRGMAAAQLSLEINLVRKQMDAQAEALRFINDAIFVRQRSEEFNQNVSDYGRIWKSVTDEASDGNPTKLSDMIKDGKCSDPPNDKNVFVINTKSNHLTVVSSSGGKISKANVYSRLYFDDKDDNRINTSPKDLSGAEGIWVEVYKGKAENNQVPYYDFYIKACWETPLSTVPITLATVIRLNEAQYD